MNRRTFLTTLAVAGLPPMLGAKVPPARHRPVVVAHRADHTQAHENSLTAIENAIRCGADFVELDLRRTQDGEHILMHDSSVDRTTNGRGAVAELTWAEIEKLRLTDRQRPDLAPEPVPRFADALKVMRGRIGLYLDFKNADREVAVRLLRAADMLGHTVVYDGLENVAAWRKTAPELPLMVSPRAEDLEGEALKELKTRYPIEILDGSARDYTAESVRAAQAAGFQVWPDIQGPWENEAFWGRMVALGTDGLQSDKPGELVAFLKRQGRC